MMTGHDICCICVLDYSRSLLCESSDFAASRLVMLACITVFYRCCSTLSCELLSTMASMAIASGSCQPSSSEKLYMVVFQN